LRIIVHFQLNNEPDACAVTGIEGDVTDFILPSVGDMVSHRDVDGKPCIGRVTERMYTYAVPNGIEVDGTVTVLLSLDRAPVH
jgi:hypothetical protein